MADDTSFEQKIDLLELVDPCAAARNRLREIALKSGEWSGIPFTLERGPPLIVEATYPWASIFGAGAAAAAEANPDDDGMAIRNRFYSHWWRCEVLVFQDRDGKVRHGKVPHIHSLDHQLATMMSTEVWGIEQEHRALQLLGTMIPHRQFKCYVLTGSFLETSSRSGVTYIFRRLRPTIAVKADGGGFRQRARREDQLKILAALCMHPIGYYENSWAGAMCPTDDVVAHLAMMRADEHMLWKRANQHPAWASQAGL